MRLEDINPNTQVLGQPDGEYFSWMPEGRRAQLRKQLGLIWDYTPSLWDEYMNIDDYFEVIEHRLSNDPEYRRKISIQAMHIRDILGN